MPWQASFASSDAEQVLNAVDAILSTRLTTEPTESLLAALEATCAEISPRTIESVIVQNPAICVVYG